MSNNGLSVPETEEEEKQILEVWEKQMGTDA